MLELRAVLVVALGLGLASACAAAGAVVDPATPPSLEGGLASCKVGSGSTRPLVVEWPAADRSELERRAREGVVAIRYDGCEMELLPSCRGPGAYRYAPVTRKVESEHITSEDELWAKLPLGAAALEGKLQKAGELTVAMTIVGALVAERDLVTAADLQGECARATHVVGALTVGAFDFYAGASSSAAAGVEVAGMGAGGGTRRQRESIHRDGDPDACKSANDRDERPPAGCAAVLRVEVVPLGQSRPPPPARPSVALGELRYEWRPPHPAGFFVWSFLNPPYDVLGEALPPDVRAAFSDWRRRDQAVGDRFRARAEANRARDDCARRGCAEGAALERAARERDIEARAAEVAELKAERPLRAKLEASLSRAPSPTASLVLADLLARAAHTDADAQVAAGGEYRVELSAAVAAARVAVGSTEPASLLGWWARYQLARWLDQADQIEASLAAWRGVPSDPERPAAWHALLMLAQAEASVGSWDAAVRAWEAAIPLPGAQSARHSMLYTMATGALWRADWRRVVDGGVRWLSLPPADDTAMLTPEVVDFVALAVRRLGGLSREPLLAAGPPAFARVGAALADQALERGDLVGALEAYEATLARAPVALEAPQALFGVAAIAEWLGDAPRATAARERLVRDYRIDSPWAEALRKARGADGKPTDDDLRVALQSWARSLPPPPAYDLDPAAPEASLAARGRIMALLRGCSGIARPEALSLEVDVRLRVSAPTVVAVKASPSSPAADALARCVEVDAPGAFGIAPHGVTATVRVEPDR